MQAAFTPSRSGPMRPFRRAIAFAVFVLFPIAGYAQQKRPLTQADWDRWQTIASPTLSADGKWVAYTLNPRVGDGEFIVRSTSGSSEYRVNVGYTNRENNTPGGERGRGGAAGGAPPGAGGRGGRGGGAGGAGPFSADGRFAFVTVSQQPKAIVDSIEAAARTSGRGGRGAAGGAGANANASSLRIVRLADGNIETVARARAFRVPDASGKWLAYTLPDSAAADSAAGRGGAAGGRGGAAAGGGRGGRGGAAGAPAAARRTYGTPVVLRNLDSGAEERIADVSTYAFDDSAKVLAYTVTSRDSTKDGVYLRDLATGTTRTVMSGPGNYRAFTFDQAQQQFVFASDKDEFGKENAAQVVYHGTVKAGTAQPILTTAALPAFHRFPDNVSASFTRAGNAVTVTFAPPKEEAVPADSLVGKAKFDLWHWNDAAIQPTQLLQVNQALNRTYQGLVTIATKKFTRLTTDSFPSATLSDDAKVALQATGVAYDKQRTWGDGGTDVWVLDPATGVRKQLAAKISGQAQLSAGGKYVTWFDKAHWYAYNVATGRTVDLNANMKSVHFEQENSSQTGEPGAWGMAGWTKDDRSVLINDRYDIWELDPNGVRPPVILTDSLGRRENMTLRLINLGRDDDERALDATKPAWLSAFDEDTKESGFYRAARLDARRTPEKVMLDPVRYGNPSKADKADVYLLTRSTFQEFPNLMVGPSLAEAKTKITDANAFQKEYSWGTSELVTWLSADGVPRQGILYKPDNFDPSKKYPMITYFYEDLSDGLHNYIAPNGGTSVNITHYVSNGYLMFEPDIYYEDGHPGQSALKTIVPGVQKLIERGYVDPKKLGLQGHSWGGYQISYMITQTGMFAAAEAGAPVANMTSAYGGIRWGSGLNRAMQYENGQSRIGKSLWEGLPLYLENSPLFHLDRVTTPLLILHNDMDDAVPWYQGIEMYIGMRRLGKEAYLFNYNNELHGIQGRANQKDWAMRMQTFFDVKLKGAPEPEWMTKGIPAKDKGKDQVVPVIRP